jgi:hypothetical protein
LVSKPTGRRQERVLKVRLLSSGEVVSEETGEAVTFERLKTERVRLHLGPGLVEPVDRRQEVSGLRNLFLERVRELELSGPKEGRELLRPVLQALAGTPFLEFTKAQVTEDDLFLLLEDACCEGAAPLPEKLGEVREAVLEWGRGTNLTAGWCLEQAVSTLWLWRESPEARNELMWENGTQLVMTVISDLPPPKSIVPSTTSRRGPRTPNLSNLMRNPSGPWRLGSSRRRTAPGSTRYCHWRSLRPLSPWSTTSWRRSSARPSISP